MANKKINQLTSKSSIGSTDLFMIGDASTGQLFKKTIADLQAAIGGGGGGTWGSITGTLSSQTDLQSALNAKQATLSGTGFVVSSGGTISYDNNTYYLASNPSSYITSSALSSYLPLTGGTLSGSLTATAFYESSDVRLKSLITDNFQVIGIENIKPKLYLKNGIEELGYFAQDVAKKLPSAVKIDDDGFLNLSYREVHTAKIAYLEKEIENLKAKLA
jgi:uncharacterized small protein (DUF1192 family)